MTGVRKAESQEPSDAEAVERARKGDHAAFRVLVERYEGRAFRLATRVLRDEEQARDAVQDAFIKVYGSLDRFEGRSGFYTWLYRITANLCIDHTRRKKRKRDVEYDDRLRHDPGAESAAAAHQHDLVRPSGEALFEQLTEMARPAGIERRRRRRHRPHPRRSRRCAR